MAGNTNRSSTNRNSSGSRNNSSVKKRNTSTNTRTRTTKSTTKKKDNSREYTDEELQIINAAIIIGTVLVAIILFLCNLGMVNTVGDVISGVMFGIFGKIAYAIPFLIILYLIISHGKEVEIRKKAKRISFIVLFFAISAIIELANGITSKDTGFDFKELFMMGYNNRCGGGIISGSITYFLNHYIGKLVTVILDAFIVFVCMFFLCGKYFIELFVSNGERIRRTSREIQEYRKEKRERAVEYDEDDGDEEDEEEYVTPEPVRKNDKAIKKQSNKELSENKKKERQNAEDAEILKKEQKRKGVTYNTDLNEVNNSSNKRDDIHEIQFEEKNGSLENVEKEVINIKDSSPYDDSNIRFHTENYDDGDTIEEDIVTPIIVKDNVVKNLEPDIKKEIETIKPVQTTVRNDEQAKNNSSSLENKEKNQVYSNKKYKFPPLSLLSKNENKSSGDSRNTLTETARKLEDALDSFGVSARVTDISQGPSVTRYELEPAIGVKVSRITSLADDLKLHLAAKDIRIEAPIPGKSAVGIEVPNAESSGVKLRELLEDNEFKNFSGNIAFAVGKDIAGKVIVTDISKMPHMLIAGSTGSGKSVCINTIIMSIIYKHDPKDVQLIMVDPKVVELNVYNGIPHLMIPVVTDPKKAAGALNWAVAEMTDRYKKFADLNVRDLKGYNKKVEDMANEGESEHKHLPQIVIIVDELADLMMVAAKEVEEAICRLAQLARACGIHLLLATQRPSVDVITGLIKANMPSRVAFAVSSGVDSRTILDMNGAEKLLGKGDMLFYPQGYTKPARIQGAFVSDNEVGDVVEFIKNQKLHNEFGEEAAQSVNKITSSGGNGSSSGDGGSEHDDLFAQAGYFIIDAGKASIGNLQRKFKIGFNRAARIMDQLCEAGVVGDEQGTKPREILMSREEFEVYVDEYV